jgi:putative peptide zinc metalloprotease protein
VERATKVSFPLPKVKSQEIKDLVRYWGERSNLKGEVLSNLLMAVNEVVEALVTISADFHLYGELVIETAPATQWLTVQLTFPTEIPLEPAFAPRDEFLEGLPEMRLLPEIFWRCIITKLVDKAVWEETDGSKTIRLTQYSRRKGHPHEFYFLNLTPYPVEHMQLRFFPEGFAVAVSTQSAFRLSQEAAFVLQAVDGKTSVREIYCAFIQEFGLVHPRCIGNIIDELSQKGLIIPGKTLAGGKASIWEHPKQLVEKILTYRYSTPSPDAFMESVNRWAGWLWSAPAAGVYAGLVAFSLWVFGSDLVPYGHIFVLLSHNPAVWTLWALLGLFWGFSVVGAIHEISHGMACKRLGGNIFAFGVMLYYGAPAVYCDTTDAWRFPNKWHRIWVSLAGPFSTSVMCCLFGWANYFLTRFGYPTLGVFFGSLAFLSMLSVVINLLPFLELDGYYIYEDFFEITNLKKKSFNYLVALGKKALGKGDLPSIPAREKVVLLIYGFGSPIFALFLITFPLYEVFTGHFSQAPRLLVWFGIFLGLLFVFQRLSLAGIHWYQRRHLVSIDLKTEGTARSEEPRE